MKKKAKIDDELIIKAYNNGKNALEIAQAFDCGERTIYTHLAKLRLAKKIKYREDIEISKQNAKLLLSTQRYQDLTRISKKQLKEKIKLENAVSEYTKQLFNVFSKNKLPVFTKHKRQFDAKGTTGIIHITDTHFNELVDLAHNKYDFPIASKRLQLLAIQAKKYFKTMGIKKVLIALTGDLLNSDRRLDELLSEATNRSKATFLAVNILEQFILDLAQDFNITVASVVGNESRIAKDVGWTEIMASDNYDYTIYNILKLIFRDSNVRLLDGNLVEQVVEVSGQNILLIHGNQFKSNSMEQSIQKIKGKYTSQKVRIDFVLSGHLHCLEPDIEVMTKQGFVQLKNINKDDVVYGYKNGKIQETTVTDVILGQHTGRWYDFNNRYISQSMTDEHCLYTKEDKYIKVKDFLIEENMQNLVCSAEPLETKEKMSNYISDDMLRLVIATCADGSYDGNKECPNIRFHFHKKRKITRLKSLFKALGYNIDFTVKDNDYKSLAFDATLRKHIVNYASDKILPQWILSLNKHQRKVVIDELKFWDGGVVNRNGVGVNSYQFCSVKPIEIDLVQRLLTMNGIFATKLENRPEVLTYNDRKYWNEGTRKYHITPEITFVKNKPVACLTTDTKNFFIRTKKGKIELTGNSARIGDTFARGGSTVGSNAYSDSALQLDGRASQNIHLFYQNGMRDSIKIDLQNTDKVKGYNIVSSLEAYNAKSLNKARKKKIVTNII